MIPQWLRELRNLLAIPEYELRKAAMQAWESRWLVELHARDYLDPELAAQAPAALLHRARERVQYELGRRLADLMVHTSQRPSPELTWGGEPRIEVRSDVLAIRAVPEEKAPECR